MLKTKVSFKFSAIVAMLFALLFLSAGCSLKKQSAEVPAAGEKSSEKLAIAENFQPLKLVYELKNFGPTGPSGKLNMTIWLEGVERCAGREAYVGLIKMDNGGQNSAFSKLTIFADNGETAVSRSDNEDKLAFDDMQSEYDQLNIYLTLNSIFAYAGKNFNAPEVWSASAPIILKNVDSGMSLTDYSVIRQTENTAGVLACQKFKIVAKGTNMNGTMNACAAKEVNGIKLPFMVSFDFGSAGQGSPSWQLKSYSAEKSGIAFVPQCMEPIKCTYIKEPAQAEKTACAARGGQFDQQRTEQGCITEYKCLTQEEIVSQSISNMQRPGCPINQAVLDQALKCRKNNQPNFSISNYDESGCALSLACRP
ncbi:MAG: hypothetical protein PHF50_02635 [Patescibacteria group bacterium]|nr:hypothetical protein [Patescibacteria group bacterium]